MRLTGVHAQLASHLPAGIYVRRRWSNTLAGHVVVLYRHVTAGKQRVIAPASALDIAAVVVELCDGSSYTPAIPTIPWPKEQQDGLRAFLASTAAATLHYRGEQRRARRPGSPTIKLNRLLPSRFGISVIRSVRGKHLVFAAVKFPKGIRTPSGGRSMTAVIGGWDQVVPKVEQLMAAASPLLPTPLTWEPGLKRQLAALCARGGGDGITLPIPRKAIKPVKTVPLLRQWLPAPVSVTLFTSPRPSVVLQADTPSGRTTASARYAADLADTLRTFLARLSAAACPVSQMPSMADEVMAPLIAELVAHGLPKSRETDPDLTPLERLRVALPADVRCVIRCWEGKAKRYYVRLLTAPNGGPTRTRTVGSAADLAKTVATLSSQIDSLSTQQREFIAAVTDGRIRLDLPWEQVMVDDG